MTMKALLGLVATSENRCNRVAESGCLQVDLSHAVEEQQSGADNLVLEFLLDESQGRARRDLQEPPPQGRALQQLAPALGRQGR
jgi:hypothetical protein